MKPDPVRIIVDRILVIWHALRFAPLFEGRCGPWTIVFGKHIHPYVVSCGADLRTFEEALGKELFNESMFNDGFHLFVDDIKKLSKMIEALLSVLSAEAILEGLEEVVEKQALLAYAEEQFAYVQVSRYRAMRQFYNDLGVAVLQNRGGVTIQKFQAPELPQRPKK